MVAPEATACLAIPGPRREHARNVSANSTEFGSSSSVPQGPGHTTTEACITAGGRRGGR